MMPCDPVRVTEVDDEAALEFSAVRLIRICQLPRGARRRATKDPHDVMHCNAQDMLILRPFEEVRWNTARLEDGCCGFPEADASATA